MSYAMRGDYTLTSLTYGIHHIGVQLVELIEYLLAKLVSKDRSHRAGLSTCGQVVSDSWCHKHELTVLHYHKIMVIYPRRFSGNYPIFILYTIY